MMEWDDYIDDYLRGRLREVELTAFEAAMASDPTLDAEVQFRREVQESLVQAEGQQLRARMQSLVAAPPRRRIWPSLAMAAAIVLLAVVGWRLLRPADSISADELMALHMHAAPQFDTQRGAELPPRPVDHAVLAQLYATQQFAAMDSLLAEAPDSLLNLEEMYMQAIALAQLHQDYEALAVCNRIALAQNRAMTERNLRLKVLLLIRLGKLDQARHDFELLKAVTTQAFAADTEAIGEWLEDQD
jgi:hypothetical protein